MQQIEFRPEQRQRLIYLAVGGLWVLITMVRATTSGLGTALVSALIAGLFFFYYFKYATFGLTVTPHGITLHGWQTRTYGWHEIRGVQPVTFWMQRRTAIQLADGSTRRAWAPLHYVTMPDPQFDLKIQAVQQWHARYAGAHPPVQPPVGAPQQQAHGQAPQQYGGPQVPQQQPYGQPAPQPYGQQAPQQEQTPGEWTQVFGANPDRPS